jgi:RNA polymerase sigma factor (sigma-70 family)
VGYKLNTKNESGSSVEHRKWLNYYNKKDIKMNDRKVADDTISKLTYYIQHGINVEGDSEKHMLAIMEILSPFRKSLLKKYTGKGLEFDDIKQCIDMWIIESIYNYDPNLDNSPIRHITSSTRNKLWNHYRKEMNYFDPSKKTISLEEINKEDEYMAFNEEDIIDKIILEEVLSSLTPIQRDVVTMYYIDDKKQKSIADELCINQSNVSRAIKRGISKINTNISI